MSDPFADGMPAGDFHTWVRPQGDPCPHCKCCTDALCKRAIEKNSTCQREGGASDFDMHQCPCWRQGSPAAVAVREAAADELTALGQEINPEGYR
jgi:predicted NBD/HSP70 family sugar kinase